MNFDGVVNEADLAISLWRVRTPLPLPGAMDQPISNREVESLLVRRAGEVRIGERIGDWSRGTPAPEGAQFALLGIAEDLGVAANFGRRGAAGLWRAALERFVNLPISWEMTGEEFVIAGSVECQDLMEESTGCEARINNGGELGRGAALAALRALVATLDERVAAAIEAIVRAGLVPIVIGGGHNNALGILRGAERALRKGGATNALSCINIDAHADLRDLEGRHSGNSFTAAIAEGILGRYAVLGLNECGTNAAIETRLASPDCRAWTLESLLRGDLTIETMVTEAVAHARSEAITLEIDLDCVEGMPASAVAASGLTGSQLRTIVMKICGSCAPISLHICEGVPSTTPSGQQVGRLTAELICDFAIAQLRRRESRDPPGQSSGIDHGRMGVN